MALAALLVAASLGCPSTRKDVVYDLARRLPVAERWSARDVVLFGTPAAEPHQADGFHRAAAGEGFVWSRDEAELSFTWPAPAPRAAVLELAPFSGVKGQSVKVRLNGTEVGGFALNDVRHRYRLALPAQAQRAGENRLRFDFAAAAAPADLDPRDSDRRRLAAAFFSVTVGPEGDAGLDDLLARGAPEPFGVFESGGAPALVQVGPSVVRFAVRLPPAAELRFTPDLHPAARAAASKASFRVTIESRPGEERELWARTIAPQDGKPAEVGIPLPGAAGDIVRIGLHVGGAPARGSCGGRGRPPACSGAAAPTLCRSARPRRTRRLAARRCARPWPAPTSCSSSSTPPGPASWAATGTAAPPRRRSTDWRARASCSSAPSPPRCTRWPRCRRCGPRSTPTATTARCPSPLACRRIV
jgi:hypothetical protein